MKRSACVFFLTTLLTGFAFGQPSDSLQTAFDSQTGIEQIKTGLQLSKVLEEDPIHMLELSFALLEKTKTTQTEPILKARILKTISDAYFFNDSLGKSSEYLNKAIVLAESVQTDSAFLAEAYNDLGLNYIELEDNSKAFEYISKSVEMFKLLNLPNDLANALSNLATVYYGMGQFDKAIGIYNEVYQIDLSTGNIKSQSSSLNNLGRMYVDWGKYETGIELYQRSLALLDTVADRQILGLRYNNIGLAFQKMNQHREAIRWIEKALQVDREENNSLKIGIRQFNLATSYLALNDYENAGYYFKLSEEFFIRLNLPARLTKVYGEMGLLYQKQENLKQAETYFLKSEQMAVQAGTIPEKAIANNYLYRFYKLIGEPAKALKYFEQYTAGNDSLYQMEAIKQIEELETKYQTEKKENEIQRLENENQLHTKELSFRKRERNWAFAGISLLTVFWAVLIYFYVTVRKQKQTLAVQNARLDELNHTQSKLFSIISHDLRNTAAAYLASSKIIQYHLEKGHPENLIPLAKEIGKNARNLSSMLENLLEWSVLQLNGINPVSKSIMVSEEFNFQVEMLRETMAAKSNQVEIISNGETVWCDPESFRLILRNLLFNACKFTSNGKISLRSRVENNSTIVEIEDTGCGMPEELAQTIFDNKNIKARKGTVGEKGTGLGLQLVHEHVLKNNGIISLKSIENVGTTFVLTFPNNAI